jgi:ankyrin repeat protein
MVSEEAGAKELARLLASGLDVSLLSGVGYEQYDTIYSSMCHAARRGRTRIVEALIDAGLTLEPEVRAFARQRPGFQDSSLHLAVDTGNIELTKLLLGPGKGKPLLHMFDHVDRTPLHIAAQRGDLPMVKLLISAGANVNAHNEKNIGFVPLDAAVGSGSVEVVRWLLGAGANPLQPTWMMVTPLDRAARNGEKGRAILEEFRKKLKMPEKQWKLLVSRTKK